jgi:hypothetical protein
MADARPTFVEAPLFNHVAMSVPAGALDAEGRAAIVRFYGEVFGWEELPTMTLDRERLVLAAWRHDQFVFLIADEHPMQAPRLDHWGLSVASVDELLMLRDRVQSFAAALPPDEAALVDLIDHSYEDHRSGAGPDDPIVLRLHSFYVRYRLPLMVEVQAWEWQ